MRYLSVGKDGLRVPALVTGCMRIAKMTAPEVSALVDASLDVGITMFDHADIYGGGMSETVFGQVLKDRPGLRQQILLQSKCGIGKGMYDASKEHILASVDGILARLGMEQLDVLLLHRPDALMEPEEVAAAFDALHAAGKVRHFGVSNQRPGQMALLAKALTVPLCFNQMQFSLMHSGLVDAGINVNTGFDGAVDRDGGTLDYCRLHDITLQAWSPFQYGFFEGVFVDNDKFPVLNAALREVAAQTGLSPSAVAVAWILRHPAGMQVVTGTTKPERVRDIARAADATLTRAQWYALYKAAGNTLP